MHPYKHYINVHRRRNHGWNYFVLNVILHFSINSLIFKSFGIINPYKFYSDGIKIDIIPNIYITIQFY